MLHPASQPYLGIPGWVYLWFLANIVLFAVAFQIWRYVSILSHARAEARSDHPLRRSPLTARQVLGQVRRLDETVPGISYVLIVWAMLAHALAFLWDVFRGTLLELLQPILSEAILPYSNDVPQVQWVLAGTAAVGLAALLAAGIARYLFTPQRLRGRYLWSFTPVLVAIVFCSSIAGALLRADAAAASTAWWTQTAGTLALIAYVAFSRDKYMLFGPLAIWSASFEHTKFPPPSTGAADRADFTWRQLLGGLACSNCGRCEVVCPAFSTLKTGSPRKLMSVIADIMSKPSDGHNQAASHVSPEYLWSCDTCGACMDVCPSFNEHVPAIIEMRRWLVKQGRMPAEIAAAVGNLAATGNHFGRPAEERARWTEALDFEVPDARRKVVEYVWIVGDDASYHPDAMDTTRAAARVLHRAGVDFGILYEAERNAGNDARRAGAEDLYLALSEHNIRTLANAHFLKIVTTDPHTYNVMKNDYEWPGKKPLVLHFSELLVQLLRRGCPSILHEMAGGVAYHDPCYLGRYNQVYDPPRRVLRETGLDLVEMSRTREMAQCCGGGGGRAWSGVSGKQSVNGSAENLVVEAASLRGVRILAVACPTDLILLRKALHASGLDKKLEVRDIAEIVDEATRPLAGSPDGSHRLPAQVH